MPRFQAVPTRRAIELQCAGIAESKRAIRDANPSVEIERSGRYDGVVEPESCEILPLSEQRRCAALDLAERHHVSTLRYTVPAFAADAATNLYSRGPEAS